MIAFPAPPHIAANTRESLRSCVGRLGIRDAPWGCRVRLDFHFLPTPWRRHPSPPGPAWAVWGIGMLRAQCSVGVPCTIGFPAPPHTTADTAESLFSCLGNLGHRDALWGGGGGSGMVAVLAPPHIAAETPESLWCCLGCLGHKNSPRRVPCTIGLRAPLHTAAHTPESLRSCLGRFGDSDAPWGSGMIEPPVPRHTAAHTPESLRSCLGRLGEREAPSGCRVQLDFQLLPTQRRRHLSPSGAARTV